MFRVPIMVLLTFTALSFTTEFPAGPLAHAQDATMATPNASIPPVLQRMMDGANAGDGVAVAALYTEDGVHEDVPAGVTAIGREEIAVFVGEVTSQFRDVRLEPVLVHQSGDLAVLEYTFSGTHLATERPILYRGVLVFELDGTLIRRSADYYDLATVLGQLGQLEVGESTAEATPVP